MRLSLLIRGSGSTMFSWPRCAIFDGRTVAEAVAAIAADKGVVMNQSLVRKMVDFGVLVPTE